MPKLKRTPEGKMCLVGSFDGEAIPRNQESTIVRYSKRMLKKPTEAERAFLEIAERIRQMSDDGIRYRRQKEFFITKGFSFIGDMYFRSGRLLVEIDGAVHNSELAKAKDQWRTELLEKYERLTVIRFPNKQVLEDPVEVMRTTVAAIANTPTGRSKRWLQTKCRRILNELDGMTGSFKRDQSGYHLRFYPLVDINA